MKLKDLICAHQYVVTVSNRFEVLHVLEDLVEFWNTFKRETLEAAKECIGGNLRSQSGFASAEMLDSIEEGCTARLAGNSDQYRAFSCRAITLLR